MNRLLLLLSMAGLLTAASCRKDDVVACVPATSNLTLEDFARRNGAPVQTFTLLLGPTVARQVLTTSGGAKITIPVNDLRRPDGSLAIGTAEVRVREIYSVPDMLLSNMPTQVGGSRKLLVSGGEFSIQIWQNSTRLRLAPGTSRVLLESPIPVGVGSGRQSLWLQPADRLVGDSAGWVAAPPRPDTVFVSTNYFTTIPLDSISWWNIDRIWNLYRTAPSGTLTVQSPAIPSFAKGSTCVFVRPVGTNGLARLHATDDAKTTWSDQLPTGVSVVVAVLQSIDGQLYFGTQAVTTQTSLSITPPLTAVSEAEAVRLIKQL